MRLEFLTGTGKIIGGGLERSKGGAFGNSWGVGLQLVGQECDKWTVECSGLCCFVGDGGAGLCVHGLRDGVQVQALIADLL